MHPNVEQILTQAHIPFKAHTHKEITTVADMEATLPFPLTSMLKTIAFKTRDDRIVLACVAGYDRIDYKALAQLVGTNRRHLYTLSPEEAESILGFQIGGICPITGRDDITTYIDDSIEPSLADSTTVYCGSGIRTATLEIALKDLVAVSDAQFAPIKKTPT